MNHINEYDKEDVKQGELALTPEQYNEIMQEIWKNHRFGMYPAPINHKSIKYVRPNWDMRDGLCFSIEFDGLAVDQRFGSGYKETTPMFDRIMKWLKEGKQ
jgi:hypothetical protein